MRCNIALCTEKNYGKYSSQRRYDVTVSRSIDNGTYKFSAGPQLTRPHNAITEQIRFTKRVPLEDGITFILIHCSKQFNAQEC